MTVFLDFLKTIVLGIIQGITEWLPISSTGHLLLFDELLPLKSVSADFRDLFMVVIQFGSILAVVVLFWRKLWPFGKTAAVAEPVDTSSEEQKSTEGADSAQIVTASEATAEPIAKSSFATWVKGLNPAWILWAKVLVAAIPAAVIGLLLDDFIEEKIYGGDILKCAVIAGALIVYGIAFIVIERMMAKKSGRVETLEELSFKDALIIGCFQVLALIPGTSRSGSTIIGARLAGISRTAAAEFSFFLALPVMLGASGLKVVKYLMEVGSFSGLEIWLLLVGMAVSFGVSLVVIKFLMEFVRRHSFECFGWYRIALGIVVLVYMTIRYIIL